MTRPNNSFAGAKNTSFESISTAILAVAFLGFFVSLLFLPLTATLLLLGWNFGITEVIQSLGGPDANINWFEAAFTVIGLNVIRGTRTTTTTNGKD